MYEEMVLPRNKVHKVKCLQQASDLFDAMATMPDQGRISEVEIRLYLAGQGAGASDVDKIIKLCKNLLKMDRHGSVTFWDFMTGYHWVAQAFNIYAVPA
eukprot:gene9790-7676_t